jgi:hypothetical protein
MRRLATDLTAARATIARLEEENAFDLMIEIISNLKWWRVSSHAAQPLERQYYDKEAGALMKKVAALRAARAAAARVVSE